MSSNPNIDSSNAEYSKTMDVQTAQRVEQEKMTRRAALRKLGFGAGMAAFALLGVDDLARMVGQRMERMAGDNKVAEQVAKEFQGMGVALATPVPYYPCISNYDCTGCGGSAATGDCCSKSSDTTACCQKSYGPSSSNGDVAACQQCCTHASPNYGAGGMDAELRRCNDMCGGIV